MVTTPSPTPTSFIKEIIRLVVRNFWLKLLSVLFAVVLFFIVRAGQDIVYDRMAKVRIVTPSNMTVLGATERYLNVSVHVQNSLFSIPPSETELAGEVDILSQTPEKLNIKVTKENFPHLPKHYSLIIERPYLEIETDRRIEKILPIQVVLKGEASHNMVVSKLTITPAQIKVSGARQEVLKLDTISTQPVNLEGMTGSFTTLIPLDMGDKTSLKFAIPSVQVSVKLSAQKYILQ